MTIMYSFRMNFYMVLKEDIMWGMAYGSLHMAVLERRSRKIKRMLQGRKTKRNYMEKRK